MILTEQHQEKLRDALRDQPLEAGELRQLDWMGEQYITREGEMQDRADCREYTELYTLRIDNIPYTIFARLPSTGSA